MRLLACALLLLVSGCHGLFIRPAIVGETRVERASYSLRTDLSQEARTRLLAAAERMRRELEAAFPAPPGTPPAPPPQGAGRRSWTDAADESCAAVPPPSWAAGEGGYVLHLLFVRFLESIGESREGAIGACLAHAAAGETAELDLSRRYRTVRD